MFNGVIDFGEELQFCPVLLFMKIAGVNTLI